MRNRSRASVVVPLSTLLLVLPALAGCGQKGPLYAAPPTVKPSAPAAAASAPAAAPADPASPARATAPQR